VNGLFLRGSLAAFPLVRSAIHGNADYVGKHHARFEARVHETLGRRSLSPRDVELALAQNAAEVTVGSRLADCTPSAAYPVCKRSVQLLDKKIRPRP
jgi:hypothetical protein